MFFTGREEWYENQLKALDDIATALVPGKTLSIDISSLGRNYVLTGKAHIDNGIRKKLRHELEKRTGYFVVYSHSNVDMSIFTISSGNQEVKFRIE